MHVIVIGAGVTGTSCAHRLLENGHQVTLIESASSPNQGCSFGMAGFMGPLSASMLCSPFKGNAGLASIFAKTRRLGWDVSIGHMKFLRALANARSADKWQANRKALVELARYSVALTEFTARMENIGFEQNYGLLKIYTNEQEWETAHKEQAVPVAGEWLSAEETIRLDPSLENVPKPFLGSLYMPQELTGNGSFFSKQLQIQNVADKKLTMMYHTTVKSLIKETDTIVGVQTDKGPIKADVVVLSNNLGAKSLLEGHLNIPSQMLTGWTITAKVDPVNVPVKYALSFENKDIEVTKLGNRLRVCGRYWLGELTHDMTDKIIEEMYESVCKLLPMSAAWPESTNWMGQTLVHPDSLPSCGATNIKGLYLNIGHGLNGWALSEGCASLLLCLIEGKEPEIDPNPYSPMRFSK